MPIFKTLLKSLKRLFKKKPRLFKVKKRPRRISRTKKKLHSKKTHKIKPSKKGPSKKKKLRKTLKLKPQQKIIAKPEGVIVGEITHFFSRIRVVVIKITNGSLSVGERILIKGQRASFVQVVESIQIESVDVKQAHKGQIIGLKVKKKAFEGDKVYKL